MIGQFLLSLLVSLAIVAPASAQRLTLTSGTPVMVTDATAQSTVYLDCYSPNPGAVGNAVLISGVAKTISSCEISMGLDAGTPHVASGSVYDIFGVDSSGLKICVGPAWSSTTSRGTGAGTTEIHLDSNGVWTNANSLTHCYGGASGTTDYGTVSADAGTYLGSLYATANGQTGMQFAPTPAAGGTNNVLGLYNAYNRVQTRSMSQDSTVSWTYASTTWRSADNSASNRITWLDGLKQSQVSASYVIDCASGSGTVCLAGVNFNSTSATPSGIVGYEFGTESEIAGGNMTTLLGLNYAQAMEARGTTGAATMTYWSSVSGVLASGLSIILAN